MTRLIRFPQNKLKPTGGPAGYRVMLVVQSLRVGGAENMVENLAYALRDRGCVMEVVVLQSGETIISRRMRANGMDPFVIGKRPGPDLSAISRLAAAMREFRPDVVHSHLPILNYVVPAARRAGVENLVHTIHNVAQRETTSRLKVAYARKCYRRGTVRPVALSEINKRTVVEFYGIPADEVAVVTNGIDLAHFERKASYAIDGTAHVCHVGRFNEQKNHEAIVEAAALLKESGADVVFDLYGEGELMDSVREMASERGVADMLAFHGLTDDVPGAMAVADIFILPSLWEGIPMVIAEAMAAGLPIVASRVGGIPDMIEDGVDGILCEPTGASLAERIGRVLSDVRLRESLGTAARRESNQFSSDLMAERYLKVYMENAHG